MHVNANMTDAALIAESNIETTGHVLNAVMLLK